MLYNKTGRSPRSSYYLYILGWIGENKSLYGPSHHPNFVYLSVWMAAAADGGEAKQQKSALLIFSVFPPGYWARDIQASLDVSASLLNSEGYIFQ